MNKGVNSIRLIQRRKSAVLDPTLMSEITQATEITERNKLKNCSSDQESEKTFSKATYSYTDLQRVFFVQAHTDRL